MQLTKKKTVPNEWGEIVKNERKIPKVLILNAPAAAPDSKSFQ
jgi:hypothetical protein